jgi:2-polyprenyl-6-methoxyphenol hydroxylase-like FAD-dependent oxidoreductase
MPTASRAGADLRWSELVTETVRTRCCIVGGGPAGMMLGFLLARAGVGVVVLEKHGDFLRDFRGDTIHPSTLEVFSELGLADELLQLPHQKVEELQLQTDTGTVTLADFRHLRARCRFIAFMPQWDFLDYLARKASSYPGFELRMRTEAIGLLEKGGEVAGVRASSPAGDLEVWADLVVGCDGRHSSVRDQAGLAVRDLGAPMDVLWSRLSRRPDDPDQAMGRVSPGRILVLLNRGTHWQCGYVIAKGTAETIRARGLESFRSEVARLAPFLGDRLEEIGGWEDVPLLSVRVDRLDRWYRPGLLLIGDAAHAMSPVGGVGINLAIQDAVATANLLAAPLREGSLTPGHLRKVQRRRMFPTRATQRLQLLVQNRLLRPTLGGAARPGLPLALRLAGRFPILRRIPGWLIGNSVRREHVHAPLLPSGVRSGR